MGFVINFLKREKFRENKVLTLYYFRLSFMSD